MTFYRTDCVYLGCNRTTDYKEVGFFYFPFDEERRNLWITNCGNPKLSLLSEEELRNQCICSHHFCQDDFHNSYKKALVRNAVPLHYITGTRLLPEERDPLSPPSLPINRSVNQKVYGKPTTNFDSTTNQDFENIETMAEEESPFSQVTNADMPPKKKYRLSHRKSSDGNDRDVIVLKSINAAEENLKLDVWIEELSPAQIEMHNKSQQELKQLTEKIQKISKQPSAKLMYQGSTCSAYEIAATVPPLIYSTAKKKPIPVSSSKNQQNVTLKQSKSNSSYKLVMDPRLGVIVGTMTPADTTGIAPTIAPPPSSAPIQTRQTRRKARTTESSKTTPQNKTQKTTAKNQKTITLTQTSAVQYRPVETKATGVVTAGATPPSVPKQNPTVSSIVDLTNDDARPMADSREVSFNKLQGKTFPSLVVVARPHLGVKDVTGGDRTKLDSKVKAVLMHVPTKFTEWLIQQGLVRSEQNCVNHENTKLKLGMYSDVTKFPYSGGYVWISECCTHRFVSVFSGSIFEGSPHPPSVILKLIYHWSCQTNVQNVIQWVKVDNLYVKGIYALLRAVCTVALHSHIGLLGGPGRRVEVGVISLGTTTQDGQQRQVKVEVLGILESEAKRIRLRAVEPLSDGDRNYKKRFTKILEPLSQWVHPESLIVTDLTVDKGTLHNMGFLHVQQTSSDQALNNHTIMDYLRRIVPRMFQNTLSLLSRQIIQQFLDELVWREWYGISAAQCFDSMILHLSEQTRANTGSSLVLRLTKVGANPFKSWNISAPTQPLAIISKPYSVSTTSTQSKRTSGRQRKIINRSVSPTPPEIPTKMPRTISPDIPEQLVPLENYYYGTIEGQDPSAHIKIGWTMKCSMCKSHFTNNIKLMNHLFTHAHTVTVGVQQCRYCLSTVGSQEGLVKHIISSHPAETKLLEVFVCIICEMRFANSFLLGKHLSKEHVPAELPYQCGTCTFRCSSHKQAIDHFYKTHDGGTTIQCPFCLKSTSLYSGGRVMPQNLNFFLQHLQKHQKKAMAKKCSRCALWFIHKDTLKDHQINMHVSQRRKAGLIPWSAPRHGLMVPKSKHDKQIWENVDKEINLSNLTISNIPNKLICKECKFHLNYPKHFQSLESCTSKNCQYFTFCKNAINNHLKICKDLNNSLPISVLPKQMYCVCGYSDDDGNTLAKHLAECERKSAYPSAESAKKAIKANSMLDVLGLMRRPEEPINQPQMVEVIDLDKDDDETPMENCQKKQKLNIAKNKKTSAISIIKTKLSKMFEAEDDCVVITDVKKKEELIVKEIKENTVSEEDSKMEITKIETSEDNENVPITNDIDGNDKEASDLSSSTVQFQNPDGEQIEDVESLKENVENPDDEQIEDVDSLKEIIENTNGEQIEDVESLKENIDDEQIEDAKSLKENIESPDGEQIEDATSLKENVENSDDEQIEDVEGLKENIENPDHDSKSESATIDQDESARNIDNLEENVVNDEPEKNVESLEKEVENTTVVDKLEDNHLLNDKKFDENIANVDTLEDCGDLKENVADTNELEENIINDRSKKNMIDSDNLTENVVENKQLQEIMAESDQSEENIMESNLSAENVMDINKSEEKTTDPNELQDNIMETDKIQENVMDLDRPEENVMDIFRSETEIHTCTPEESLMKLFKSTDDLMDDSSDLTDIHKSDELKDSGLANFDDGQISINMSGKTIGSVETDLMDDTEL